MKKLFFLLSAALILSAKGDTLSDAARTMLKKAKPGVCAVRSEEGIFYHTAELEHLSKGELDGAHIRTISRSRRPAGADPVPAIVHFHEELKKSGIRLILIPVPPKAAVHPLPGLREGDAAVHLRKLYDVLRKKGVTVLDMTGAFVAMKKAGAKPFCFTDSHWSPQGLQATAEECASVMKFAGNGNFSPVMETKEVRGDLLQLLSPGGTEKEELTLRKVKDVFSDDSPVLVIGDSHIMIFSSGDSMLAENAGFCEQLALLLRSRVERIGTLGSASTSVRVRICQKARKDPAWLAKKKQVVWVFSARELTESENGWMKVPVRLGK